MSEKKIQKSFIDYGFGFPIEILSAPMIKIRGKWVLDLNLEKYERAVLIALSQKPSRLTGNEIKFIRNHFQMTFKEFGTRFGNLAHSAVIKWENYGDDSTNMNWACEKDIRLFIVHALNPKILIELYAGLEKVASDSNVSVKIRASDINAA
ncbi:MAG: hypothetical protein Fur0010_28150 [Bdellovibrio sp.]